eukprot:311957-Chlamydomonas_euryale.AAC.7
MKAPGMMGVLPKLLTPPMIGRLFRHPSVQVGGPDCLYWRPAVPVSYPGRLYLRPIVPDSRPFCLCWSVRRVRVRVTGSGPWASLFFMHVQASVHIQFSDGETSGMTFGDA